MTDKARNTVSFGLRINPLHKMQTNLKSGFLEAKDFYPNQSQGLYI